MEAQPASSISCIKVVEIFLNFVGLGKFEVFSKSSWKKFSVINERGV